MRMIPFYQAFMICIRTVEYSNPSLLVTIDPKLVKNKGIQEIKTFIIVFILVCGWISL
jgi:hypothetical protein